MLDNYPNAAGYMNNKHIGFKKTQNNTLGDRPLTRYSFVNFEPRYC